MLTVACLCSVLRHPHLLQPKSMFRKDNLLFIVQDHVNGGDVFSLAKRAGPHGLPERAARFLVQQLVHTLIFAHDYNITLQDIDPSRLLLSWNDKAVPVLRVNALQPLQKLWPSTASVRAPGPCPLPRLHPELCAMCRRCCRQACSLRLALPHAVHAGLTRCDWCVQQAGRARRVATMYSSIHWLRETIGGADAEAQARAAASCDLWSVAATLYFLLFGCWPFSKAQISRWLETPAEEWNDDDLISYSRAPRSPPAVCAAAEACPLQRACSDSGVGAGEGASPPSDEVVAFLKAVFATGRHTLAQTQAASRDLTLAAVAQTEWFREDLPDGVDRMNAECRAKTEHVRASPQFAEQRQQLMQLAAY